MRFGRLVLPPPVCLKLCAVIAIVFHNGGSMNSGFSTGTMASQLPSACQCEGEDTPTYWRQEASCDFLRSVHKSHNTSYSM